MRCDAMRFIGAQNLGTPAQREIADGTADEASTRAAAAALTQIRVPNVLLAASKAASIIS